MKATHPRVLATAVAAVFSLLALTDSSAAQRRPILAPQGVPQDWSHRSVVYKPDTPEEAARKGRTAQWQRDYQDPRFVVALTRKLLAQAEAQDLAVHATAQSKKKKKPPVESGMHRDWSEVMGGGTNGLGGVGMAGVYPAKFSFSLTAAPDCNNDFVVYPTAAAGSTAVSGSREGLNSAFTAGTPTGTITIGAAGTARSIVLTAGASNSGLTFQATATPATNATNLINAVNRWSNTTGITAQQLPVLNPAGVEFFRNTPSNTTTISVTDNLTVYTIGTNANGSGTLGEPTVIAFNQLYSSCGSVTPPDPYYPSIRWAYNTSLAGENDVAETSPVISYYDGGKQIAFVQRNPAPNPDTLELVLLKPGTATGTAGGPSAPPLAATASDYRNDAGACNTTAGCMFVIGFSGASDTNGAVTFSAPYVDYFGDVLWVGDGTGHLHKFTGVFGGTPAEVTATFPVSVSAGNTLSSPVYDGSTGMVFVGSASAGAGSGGMLHRVDAGTGALTSSAKLTINNSLGLRASPILDSSAQRVYAFVFDDGGGAGTNCNLGGPCREVVQFDTAFAAGGSGAKVLLGRGNDTVGEQYMGTFDNAYYNSATPDGALYVAGGDPDNTFIATLWKIPIVSNVMGTPLKGATISGNDTTIGSYTSPISEVENGTHDYLYVGVHDFASDGTAAVCGTGAVGSACLYMFDLSDLNGTAVGTGAAWGTTNVPFAGLSVVGGTGGIVIDNVSSVTGASQVYFSNLSSPGNAYQASQSDLQ